MVIRNVYLSDIEMFLETVAHVDLELVYPAVGDKHPKGEWMASVMAVDGLID